MPRPIRSIIHIDMDAFYPAVEVLDDPRLQGKPVIVGGMNGRGVVSSASYEAREYGIYSSQPITAAKKRCPHGIFKPVRMHRYKELSDAVFSVFLRFTPLVEKISIDEAFLDVTDSARLFGSAAQAAQQIKDSIKKEIGLTASAGTAPSKMVAKTASAHGKPDGLIVVAPDRVQEFLNPLPITRLWGVGRSTLSKLTLLGVKTIGDLKSIPLSVLQKKFGRHGLHLHLLSQGIDDRSVVTETTAKSVGHEETFPDDICDPGAARKELLSLSMRVARRLRKHNHKAKSLTVKVRYSDFSTITRSQQLGTATDDGRELYMSAKELMSKTEIGRRPVRLLGIQTIIDVPEGGFRQRGLFQNDMHKKKEKLNKALDDIADKYGDLSIVPGTLLEK